MDTLQLLHHLCPATLSIKKEFPDKMKFRVLVVHCFLPCHWTLVIKVWLLYLHSLPSGVYPDIYILIHLPQKSYAFPGALGSIYFCGTSVKLQLTYSSPVNPCIHVKYSQGSGAWSQFLTGCFHSLTVGKSFAQLS